MARMQLTWMDGVYQSFLFLIIYVLINATSVWEYMIFTIVFACYYFHGRKGRKQIQQAIDRSIDQSYSQYFSPQPTIIILSRTF